MHIEVASFNSNPNLGLFCFATDKYCLVPHGFPEKLKKMFHEVLKVPVHEMRASGTSLLGVFFSGNDELLLVPDIMFDSELKYLDSLNIKYKVVETILTALGNNLLVSGSFCIANPDFSEKVVGNLESWGFVVKKGKIAGLNIVGSLAKGNKKGILVSSEAEDFERKFLKDNLKVKITKGTVNFGSPYVSSGFVCNSNGFVIGDVSGGPEIQNADVALGFIEG